MRVVSYHHSVAQNLPVTSSFCQSKIWAFDHDFHDLNGSHPFPFYSLKCHHSPFHFPFSSHILSLLFSTMESWCISFPLSSVFTRPGVEGECEVSRRRQWPPLQYSCLEIPMDRGAWWAAVHGVTKSRTWWSDFTLTFHFHALEKEMATHFSILAWRIPGMAEPDGLPSMGSHRVRHDWSDLAVAAAAVCS